MQVFLLIFMAVIKGDMCFQAVADRKNIFDCCERVFSILAAGTKCGWVPVWRHVRLGVVITMKQEIYLLLFQYIAC